jgi:predicted amino acid racemase
VEQVIELVAQLAAAGRLSAGNASALQSLLRGALQNINIGDLASAMNQLEAVLRQITAFEGSGKLSAADAAMLRAAVLRVLQSVSAVRQPQ